MKTFSAMEEWRDNEETHRKERFVIGMDVWNWCIGVEDTKQLDFTRGIHYTANLKSVFRLIFEKYHKHIHYAVEQCVLELAKKTGKKMVIPEKLKTIQEYMAFGDKLDKEYDLSFAKTFPPKVCQRMFPGEKE